MSKIRGTLNIMNDISRLDGDLLLKAEIPDETQAKFAATSFLEDDRDLHTNDFIEVTGERVSPGKIRMSDASAATAEEFIASVAGKHLNDVAIAASSEGTTKRKKRGVRRKSKKSDKKIEVEC